MRRFPTRAGPLARLATATLLAAVLLPAVVRAQAAGYRLDPVHTRVLFAIDHAGYSRALGTVSGSTGVLLFDPGDWSSARLSVEVPLQQLDMGDAGWTRAVLARRFLDVARYPTVRFVSSHVEPVNANNARVCGKLSLHGVTRDHCLDITFNQLRRYPLPPFRNTAGFTATTTLQRSDFGIDAWKSLVGDRVELQIEAEAVGDESAAQALADQPAGQDAAAGPTPPGPPAPPADEPNPPDTPEPAP